MKTLIILGLLISTCLSRTVDTIGVMPFGPDLDLRNEITIVDLLKKFGLPDSMSLIKDDYYIHYPTMNCYFYTNKLYSIEIIEGSFQNLKIGMSKRKIQKRYGKSTIIKTFPNNEEIQEFGYYDQDWVRYIITFTLKDKKLAKILIRKEDDWL